MNGHRTGKKNKTRKKPPRKEKQDKFKAKVRWQKQVHMYRLR